MTQKKSPNLIKVFLLKEKAFWRRTWNMHKQFKGFWKFFPLGFPLALTIITVAHYAFALMHFLFECFLWLVLRPQFKANMRKLQLQAQVA